jgi:hypothetical protein
MGAADVDDEVGVGDELRSIRASVTMFAVVGERLAAYEPVVDVVGRSIQ